MIISTTSGIVITNILLESITIRFKLFMNELDSEIIFQKIQNFLRRFVSKCAYFWQNMKQLIKAKSFNLDNFYNIWDCGHLHLIESITIRFNLFMNELGSGIIFQKIQNFLRLFVSKCTYFWQNMKQIMKAKSFNLDNFYNIWDCGHQHVTRVNHNQIQVVCELGSGIIFQNIQIHLRQFVSNCTDFW